MITVKDIQEKEFSTQAAGGYNLDEVDDFLDEVATRLGSVIQENSALKAQIEQLQEQLKAAETEKETIAAKVPDFDTEGYFNNIKSVMQESLAGAQRVADETIANAKRKAQETIDKAVADAEKTRAGADEYARVTTSAAEQKLGAMNAETDRIRGLVSNYAASFKKLMEDQLAALKEGEALLK